MLPSPMAFSPFSSSSSNRNLRTIATQIPMYLSQTRNIKNNIRFMPQKFKKTHSTSLFFFRINSLIFLFSLSLCVKQFQCSTLCDRIRSSMQKGEKQQLNTFLQLAHDVIYEPCFLELTPKYYWGQNMSHLMVKFEFLNSADTSACGRVLSVKKEIQHEYFAVSLICTMSQYLIRYRIKVRTFMPLNYYQAVWKEGQQNTIYLECMKSPNPYFWKSLYSSKHVPVRKPRIWWKIMEKYQSNLKDFIYDLEVEEEDNDISGYVKSKRQIKKTRWWQLYDPESQKYLFCNQNNVFELGSWIY